MYQYFPEVNLELLRRELFNAVHEAHVIVTIPTIFYFEGEEESKLFNFMHSSKLADTVYTNLQVLKEREWNAIIIFQDGIVHVFFGKNDGILELPEVFNSAVQGSC